jgi:hypothetical protein
MIDTSIARVHQHGACITRNRRQSMGRSRGGLTSKIHAVVDANGPAGPAGADARRGPRQSACWQTFGSSEVRIDVACRPWVRRGMDQRTCHQERRMGQHPTEKQSERSDLLQALISTAPATWSRGSSIGSSNVVGSLRAMISLPPITLRSSSLHPSGCGWLRVILH